MRRSYLLYCRLDNISAVFLPFSELNAVEQDSEPADFDQLLEYNLLPVADQRNLSVAVHYM